MGRSNERGPGKGIAMALDLGIGRIRRWAAKTALGETYEELTQARQALVELVQWRPIRTMMQLQSLEEYDSRFQALVSRLTQYQSGVGMYEPSENDRLIAISEARQLEETDPVVQRAIALWTDYGFGQTVEIKCRDKRADEVFQEFWTAHRNRPMLGARVLFELSKQLLTDGEMFWPFFISKHDATATIRLVTTEEVKEILTEPGDNTIPLLYQRTYVEAGTAANLAFSDPELAGETVYYTDWMAYGSDELKARLDQLLQDTEEGEVKLANQLRPNTIVLMMHVSHNRRGIKDLRGWPITKSAGAWARAYHQFLQNRAAVARSVAMFVDKLTVKGPSGPLDAIKNTFDRRVAGVENLLNQREPVGATWMQNEQLDRNRMPLSTGAGDARTDGMTILAQAATGMQIPPNLLGRPDMMQNRSVADVGMIPFYETMERYQHFWADVWRDVVDLVLTAHEHLKDVKFSTHECDVSQDVVATYELGDIIMVMDQALALKETGANVGDINKVLRTLMIMTLQFVGVKDADAILKHQTVDKPATTRDEDTERLMVETEQDYISSLSFVAEQFWSKAIDFQQFYEFMIILIRNGFAQAWHEGLAQLDILPAEMSPAERVALEEAILKEVTHVGNLADLILNQQDKEWGPVKDRLNLWTHRYSDIRTRAILEASGDPKLKWVADMSRENCASCLKLHGKVKRKSYWLRVQVHPQSPKNVMLECQGFGYCQLLPTEERCSPGPLPNLP